MIRLKGKNYLLFLSEKQAQLYCLQDVHFTEDMEQGIREEWGFNNCYFSSFKSNARGVAIFGSKNLDFQIENEIRDHTGNKLTIEIKIEEYRLAIITVYGPNTDSPTFIEEIASTVKTLKSDHIVICGDWNIIQNYTLDAYNYKTNQ